MALIFDIDKYNMKVIKVLLMAVILFQISEAELKAQGIKFEVGLSWEQIKQKAKTENKYIFLDMYTTWCGPCKAMDKNVYSAKLVGDFYNQGFISVKVQLDSTDADKIDTKAWYKTAQELGRLYNITAYPSYVFLNPEGALVNKQAGLVSTKVFLSFGDDAKNAEKQYNLLKVKYEQGNREPNSVRLLIRTAYNIGQKAKARQIAQNYIKSLTDEQMFELENIWCLYENTKTSQDRGFAFFRDSAKKIAFVEPKMKEIYSEAKIFGIIKSEQIDPYLKMLDGKPDWKKIDSALVQHGEVGKLALKYFKVKLIVESEIMPYAKNLNGKPDWEMIMANIKRFGIDGEKALEAKKDFLVFESEIIPFLKSSPNWSDIQCKMETYSPKTFRSNLYAHCAYYFADEISRNVAKDYTTPIASIDYFIRSDSRASAAYINEAAWSGFLKFQRKSDLETALRWAKLGLEKNSSDARTLDTYANLLYRLGNKHEALIAQEKAVKLDPYNAEIANAYEKMKKGFPTWVEDKL